MIRNRNPEYKEKTDQSLYFQGGLLTKDLIAMDVFIQGERIRIKKKQKFIVQHIKDCWWVEYQDYNLDSQPPYVQLYSINDIDIKDGEACIRFCYQNGPALELMESEILNLIPVRKKARRGDDEIKELIEELGK